MSTGKNSKIFFDFSVWYINLAEVCKICHLEVTSV